MSDDIFQRSEARRERRRLRIEVDEDESVPGFQLQLRQAEARLVEVARAAHRRGADELAVESIGPVMVGADERARVAAAFGDEHAPVLAYGGHGIELAVRALAMMTGSPACVAVK